MAFAFEKLLVYQKAIDFADRVCQLAGGFPRGFWFLADQLNRAALSIATNIAEGNGRFTKADRRNFFGIARGSRATHNHVRVAAWLIPGERGAKKC